MADFDARRVVISRTDLVISSMAVEARFEEARAETERTHSVRELLAASLALEHAVRAQSRCALVNHCGSHGTTNLTEATDTLFEALASYAVLVREVAARFGGEAQAGRFMQKLEAV